MKKKKKKKKSAEDSRIRCKHSTSLFFIGLFYSKWIFYGGVYDVFHRRDTFLSHLWFRTNTHPVLGVVSPSTKLFGSESFASEKHASKLATDCHASLCNPLFELDNMELFWATWPPFWRPTPCDWHQFRCCPDCRSPMRMVHPYLLQSACIVFVLKSLKIFFISESGFLDYGMNCVLRMQDCLRFLQSCGSSFETPSRRVF